MGVPSTLWNMRAQVHPSQCNNMFVFPGLGLGASVAERASSRTRSWRPELAQTVNVEGGERASVSVGDESGTCVRCRRRDRRAIADGLTREEPGRGRRPRVRRGERSAYVRS